MLAHRHTYCANLNLDRPYFAVFSEPNRLVLSDTEHHRLVVVDVRSGAPVRVIGTAGREPSHFNWPMGVAAGEDCLFVADMGNHRVQKISLLGESLAPPVGSWGDGDGELRSPQGLAFGGGLLFVADTSNNRICVFEDFCGLRLVGKWGSRGSGAGEFNGPTGVAVEGEDVYVADRYNHRVQLFDSAGTLRRIIGGERGRRGLFNEPFGVALGPRELIVSEYLGCRLQVLSRQGVPLHCVALPPPSASYRIDSSGNGSGGWLGGVCADGRGGVVVAEPKAAALHHVCQSGVRSLQWYSFDALLRQCADERERDELVSELREMSVGIALDAA